MQYHLYLVRVVPGEAPTHEVIASIDSEAPSAMLETRLKSEILAGAQQAVAADGSLPLGAPAMAQPGRATRGRKGKKISIRHIEPEREAYVSLRVGEIVNSSMELSLLLGYSYNMVSQVMSIAARKKAEAVEAESDRTERAKMESEALEVTLRDVTFCYVDELAKNEN